MQLNTTLYTRGVFAGWDEWDRTPPQGRKKFKKFVNILIFMLFLFSAVYTDIVVTHF